MPRGSAEYKYTVESLADALGIGAPQVRVKLRQAGADKNEDGVYGWNSQQEFLKVKASISGGSERGGGKSSKPEKSGKKKAGAKKAVSKKKRTPRQTEEAEAA